MFDAARATESVHDGVCADAEQKPPREREQRKVEGWCVYSVACPRRAHGWPDPEHAMCTRHMVRSRKRQAEAKAERRAQLAGAGKCIRCRKPSSTYRCPRCRILDQTPLPSGSVHEGVSAERDLWRRDNDGWQRYRGQGRRGAPAASDNDEQDLARAFDALERGRQSLLYAHSPQVRQVGRDAAREARAAAAGILAMAAGFVADVVSRNRPPSQLVLGVRAQVREALGEGVDQEVIDDAMIDRVIAAARATANLPAAARKVP